MKKKDLKMLREQKASELGKLVLDKKLELLKASLKTASGKNLKKSKNLRRDLAQILTVVREKEIIGKEEKDKKDEKSNR